MSLDLPTEVLVCPVSTFATPNITPILDKKYKPQKVVLLVSPEMSEQGQWLETVLGQLDVAIDIWALENAWDVDYLYAELQRLLDVYEGVSIALNATCGTKPMTIACYEVFRSRGKSVFYIDPNTDHLIWMYPHDGVRYELADRIRIPEFVRIYGGQVSPSIQRSVQQSAVAIGEALVGDPDYYAKAIGSLNYYASSAKRNLLSSEMDERTLGSDAFNKLLDQLEQGNQISREFNKLRFHDENARFFANGGWLEQYVFSVLLRIKGRENQLQDAAMSVEVERKNSVKNEVDVAFLFNNKLHIIECKAKSFKGGKTGSATDVLYKIDSVSEILGGIQAKAMLVSYKKLPDHDLRRAHELGVKVVQHNRLRSLESELRDWLG